MAGKTYPLLAASLAAVFALSACSRDVKPAPEFKRTDYERVVVSNGVEPGTLDPQMSGDMAAGAIIRQLMDGLVGTDAEGKTIPALAEKWESEGERIWTFHLRDAKWSMAIRLLPKILYTASAVLPIRPPAHLSAAIWSMPKWKMRKIY